MARITRRRRRKRVRYFSPTLRSSSESEGGGSGGSEEERDESEKQERRWQLRQSTLESRAKGKQVVKEAEEEDWSGSSSTSSSEDDTTAEDGDGQQLQQQQQQAKEHEQHPPKEEDERQEMRHSNREIAKEEICGICLSEGGNERGKLDCCDHFFCFACIMEWSKVESRCPMCKQRFVTVMRPAVSGVSRSRTRSFRIPTRDQVYEPSEEEIRLFTDPYQNTVCTECQEAGDEGLLLLCDRCDAAAHTYCVGLGRSVPRGDWFCHACHAREMESSEEDDGEDMTFDTTDIDEEEGSGTESILAMIVGGVPSNIFTGRTRRSAASQGQVPLRRSNRRRVRRSSLSDPTAPTDTLMLSITSTSERRGFFPSLIETHPARTLSHQRQVQATVHNRLQNMRENWNRYRSGEVQFGSVGHSVESSRPGSAVGGSSSTPRLVRSTSAATMGVDGGEAPTSSQTRGAGRAAESGDIEQAWVNLERARRLGESTAGPSQPVAPSRLNSAPDWRNGEVRPHGTPVSARTRERTHQLDIVTRANSTRGPPVERNSQGDDHSRANSSRRREESRASSARPRDERHTQRRGWTDSEGEGLDLSNSRSANGRHFDRRESCRQGSTARPPENGNVDILSCGDDNSRCRYHLRESNRQHVPRTANNLEDSAVTIGTLGSPTFRENRSGTEGLTLRSLLDDKDNSRGSGGVTTRSREAKETQMLHVQSILDDQDNSRGSVGVMTRWREAKDAQGLHGRSILDDKENSRGSTGPTTRSESDRSRSQSLSHDRGQSASRNPNRDEEMKLMKAQCFDLVNNALKPILGKGTIDKNLFKELARSATHTILSSLGVPGLKHEGDVVAVGTITCDHEQATSSSLIPGCCTPCVQRHVKRYVKSLVKEKMQLKCH